MGFITEMDFTALLESFKRVEGRDWSAFFTIFDKCVSPMIVSWYIGLDDELRGIAKTEEDYISDVRIKLMGTIESSLLKHEGQDLSARAAQLHEWLKTATKNELRDEYKILVRDWNLIKKMEETQPVSECAYDYEGMDEHRELLNASFRLVINSRSDIHKILFWLNLSLHTLATINDRSTVKKHITPILSDMPLIKMYETVQAASKKLGWMQLTDEDIEKIESALARPHSDGTPLAHMTLSEFYGNRSATAATSDWVNKIDEMIGRNINKWLV